MSRLDELIAELCPDGVNYKTLGEVADAKTGRKPIYISEEENGYEYINAGTTNSGYTNSYNCEADTVTTPSRGQGGIGFVGYQSKRFWLGPLCYQIRAKTSVIMNRFIYYVLQSSTNQLLSKKNEGGTPSLNQSDLLSITIPVPPLPVQREIVRILDHFTELTAELTAELTTELTARQKQYEYYRDLLIDNAKGEMGKLICLLKQPITDGPHTTPKFVSEGVPFISATAIFEGRIHLESAQGFITKEFDGECAKKYKPQKFDVYMVKSGSTTGKVAIVDIDDNFNIWSPLAAMRAENETTAWYLYHLLQTSSVQNQVLTRMSHGSQPNLSMRTLERFDVKIPSLAEQKRIVSILDKLDNISNSIVSGIPAEIAARQKQYEYYRDKLLTFERM